ncbi:MAG TPA: EAL domain-containing protein [Usitatibacter sp.]|jgi:diguanylate cyclase (GGDEF)-like protein|nr:EAL domain-containing protein [Usitatibacter sp.]
MADPITRPKVPRLSSLGTRLVIFFVALLVLVQGLGAFLVIQANSQIARQTIDQELEQGERVFRRLLAQNQARLEQGAAILSADFAFRQAIATDDGGTIASVLRNHGARVGATVMMLVSLDKVVKADTGDPSRIGKPFAFPALIDAGTVEGKASSIVLLGERLHQLVVVPVLAPDPIAYVGLAFEVDDAAAQEMNRLSGLEVSFVSGQGEASRLHASTLAPALRTALGGALASLPPGGAFREVDLGGEEYETRTAALPTSTASVVAVLQKPLAVGLAPFRRISTAFFWLTLAGLAALVIGSLVIARSITRPVSRLADAARRVQEGDYTRHLEPAGRDEIGELAVSFNHMLDGIQSREKEILRLAYEDGLTGLPNRAMFNQQLEQAVRTARRESQPLAVMIFDMDRFKAINDTLGHPVGDQALREVGLRVRKALRDSDVVARLGGDEFAILLATGSAEHAIRVVAGKIIGCLEAPLVIDGQSMDIAASIGIARFPEHGEEASALMRAADVAMYAAKRSKSGFEVYDPTHDERRQEYLSLLGELRRAVEAGELVLHYQPKMSLAENRTTSVEALVRWRHPTRGFVPPSEFIPFAEQTGYISSITRWVMGRAIEQAGEWHRLGLGIRMCVNVSARDLRSEDTLVQYVWAALLAAELPPGMLCLEVTESGLMDDPRSAQSTLRKLRDLGIATSIDDYGTGYSSLAYIKQLAVNELKIDRAFVSGMEADSRNAAIVRSTIELGHNLGLSVVAEGVETEHELAELRRFGCDVIQGYLYARPMAAEALEGWLGGTRERAGGSLRATTTSARALRGER